MIWFTVDEYKCGLPHTVDAFDTDELAYASSAYKVLLPEIPDGAVPVLFDRYSTVEFAGEIYRVVGLTRDLGTKIAHVYKQNVNPITPVNAVTVHNGG